MLAYATDLGHLFAREDNWGGRREQCEWMRWAGTFSDYAPTNVTLLANHQPTFGARLTNVKLLFVCYSKTPHVRGTFFSGLLKCVPWFGRLLHCWRHSAASRTFLLKYGCVFVFLGQGLVYTACDLKPVLTGFPVVLFGRGLTSLKPLAVDWNLLSAFRRLPFATVLISSSNRGPSLEV